MEETFRGQPFKYRPKEEETPTTTIKRSKNT